MTGHHYAPHSRRIVTYAHTSHYRRDHYTRPLALLHIRQLFIGPERIPGSLQYCLWLAPFASMMKRPAAAEPETARGRKRSASVSLPDSPKRKRQTSASSSSAGPVKLDGLYEVEETCGERYRREPPPPTCGLWVGNRWLTDTGIHIIVYTYP